MVSNKSLDEYKLIASLLHDVHDAHGSVFNTRALRLTLQKVEQRVHREGLGFLTKTLSKLGKAFDKALTENTPLNANELRFKPLPNSNLPRFLGEFFSRVLRPDGTVLTEPCDSSVRVIRQVLYLFYKYELPYSDEQEQDTILRFKKTEEDILSHSLHLREIEGEVKHQQEVCATRTSLPEGSRPHHFRRHKMSRDAEVARMAKIVLNDLFCHFDPTDIVPSHGPGAVATKQKLWSKYEWTNVSKTITDLYPYDEYFCSSLGQVCDSYRDFSTVTEASLPAQVLLVPKDSRGPRLISCEPVDYQWIQQGLGRAIVEWVESAELTKFNVHFTCQLPNRFGALLGSETGKYATLDLNEASDRVSVDLVRLLFPAHITMYLEACRSSSTVLPDGKELKLNKFAPMGSSLCFPILALTCWALLTAAAPDADTRERILVYGDDVIVPTAFAADAMSILESFGLKINRDKSCTSGFFRESCGMDAFRGTDVTPVRLRTVWSPSPSPESYTSWIAYANSFYDKKYPRTYQLIVDMLLAVYGEIPDDALSLKRVPSLREVPQHAIPKRRRWNPNLQRFEYRLRTVKSPSINKEIDGWSMLLRFFTEGARSGCAIPDGLHVDGYLPFEGDEPFSVRSYTKRRVSMLTWCWR